MEGFRTVSKGDPSPRPHRRRSAWWPRLGLSILLLALLVSSSTGSTKGHPSPDLGRTVPSSDGPVPNVVGAADWVTFHGSEDRAGVSPIPGPVRAATAWQHQLSGYPIRVGPVANSTRVFLADDLGNVFALNLQNGSVAWRSSVGLSPTTAELVGNLLVLGSGNGYLSALNASNGANVWVTSLGSRAVGAVTVANGSVLVGTTAGQVSAFSLRNGTHEWSRSLGAAVAGALAFDGARLYAATAGGIVSALDLSGRLLWGTNVSAPLQSGPAVAAGRVLVGDLRANLTALNASTGAKLWSWSGASAHPGDAIQSTPALSDGAAFFATFLGGINAVDLSNGSLRWNRSVPFDGYPVLSSPAAAPNAVYLIDGGGALDALSPSTGAPLWTSSLNQETSYAPPALENGALLVANEQGWVWDYGRAGGGIAWPVGGHVTDAKGRSLPSATVATGGIAATVASDGRFLLNLTNGSYELTASAPGYDPSVQSVLVTGPISNLTFALHPITLYPMGGVVTDAVSGATLGGLLLIVQGVNDYSNRTYSGVGGAFELTAPNGSNYLTVQAPDGYDSVAMRVTVAGAAVSSVRVALPPTTLLVTSGGTLRLDLFFPLAAVAGGATAAGYVHTSRRRVAEGLAPGVLSPFARFVAMRLLLIPAQAAVVLTILYVFGTFLPLEAQPGSSPCALVGSACSSCSWSDFLCTSNAFLSGLGTFLHNLFTGQWGYSNYNHLQEPSSLFLKWWLPYSIELAIVALLLSAAIAYPLGLFSGWRRDTAVDVGSRIGTTVGLLIPTFLLVLFIFSFLWTPFQNAFGDWPYDVVPSPAWWAQNGGQPRWFGSAYNSTPTGFPLIDGALHGAWTFELIVATKTLLQALVISVIYVGIFLRYARNAVVEAVTEPHVQAARARGIPESQILWHHTARRVLPIYLLVFGMTLPAYLGTQAVVEALSSDHGVGTLLIAEMTHFQSSGFGFATTAVAPHPGNFYQVAIFLLVLLVLLGNLAVDVIARYLDPRLVRRERL